jgi:glycine cleavage system H protein
MTNPSDRRYSRSHEWVLVQGEQATIGITNFAQEQLGDVVFVDLPPSGKKVDKGAAVANIESVKAVSEVFAPVAGEVTDANKELEVHPELINQDAFGKGWLVKLKVVAGAGGDLMDSAAYEKFCAEEGAH